ncbi:MAG: hypothetical protein HY566_03630 [Candidatus Kerfeldbacteria bacterium]|nr:hypothetical protein [Candidatus Kerfeldbacteria bacterium]
MLPQIGNEHVGYAFQARTREQGGWTLKSGRKSPLYFNLRLLRSDPRACDWALTLYKHILDNLQDYDLVADVPTAGTPIVAILGWKLGVPMISPRPAKQHGAKNTIDGIWTPGQTVVLIDDLVTDAGSKLETAAILREKGLVVNDVVVLIDREEGGREELAKHGLNLHAAMSGRWLVDLYWMHKMIGPEVCADIQKYWAELEAPVAAT